MIGDGSISVLCDCVGQKDKTNQQVRTGGPLEKQIESCLKRRVEEVESTVKA